MTADEVEECWQLLRQSLHSVSYETLAHLPTYSQWLAEQDWTKPYQRHRKNLQLIGLNDAEKRWVLKNPSHLFALDALFATYPDALVVQCHRPAETHHGVDVLAGAAHDRGLVEQFVGDDDRAGLDWRRGRAGWSCSMPNAPNMIRPSSTTWTTSTSSPTRSASVEAIYRHFGIDFTDAARAAAEETHAESKKGPRAPEAHLLAGRLRPDRRPGQGTLQGAVSFRSALRPSYWPVSQSVSARPEPATARRSH